MKPYYQLYMRKSPPLQHSDAFSVVECDESDEYVEYDESQNRVDYGDVLNKCSVNVLTSHFLIS